ncbi:MAG: glycosyltransferase family 2 protein, partial [Eubacteriales bacterium]|nr:glycosyltransferase family 2 protein [Eubacteriales bacterium]
MSDTKTIDIIVPCCNEGQNIDAFYEEAKCIEGELEGYTFTFIFVDDGSTDSTLEEIKKLSERAVKEITSVKYISFSRNFGKEAAMYAGLRASAAGSSDYAVIIDGDLQHPPALIKNMVEIIDPGSNPEGGKSPVVDCVAARRVSRKGEPKIRSIFARAFYRIMKKYSDIEIVDGAVDFRLMTHRMVKAIASMPETQRFSKGIFAWVGFNTEWIEFENVRRFSGESKWTIWGLTKYAIDGFIDFADFPLKFLGAFGGVVAAGSVIYLIIEIVKTLVMGKDIPGYASTICLILFFGGF